MIDEEKSRDQLLQELQTLRNELAQWQAVTQPKASQNGHSSERPTEEALRESDATLRSLYDSASMLMGVVELLDNDVLHISVNRATINFFGIAPEAIKGKLASQLGASEELSRLWIAAYQESERSGEPFRFEYKLEGRKGERLLAATVSHIGEIAEGHNRFCYIVEDITERKRIEEAARESEARYRHLVNNAGDIIYKTDAHGNIVLFNPTATRILGYTEEELLGRYYLDLVRPDYRQLGERFYGRQFVKRIAETYLEFPALAKDGSIVWLEQNVRLVMQGDEVIGFDTIARDISKRKEAEEATRRAESQVRTLVENAKDVIARFDRERRYLYVNPAVKRLSGREPESFIGKRFGDSGIPASQVALWNAAHQKVCETGKEAEVEFVLPTPEGMLYRLSYMVPEFGSDGTVESVLVVTRDISQRKRAEEATRRAESQVRTLVENAKDVIARFDRERRYLYVNPAIQISTRLKPESFIGNRFGDSGMPESQIALWNAAHQKVCETGKETDLEFIYPTPEGNIYCQSYMVPEFGSDGTVESVLVVTRDISERKHAEERLRESEARTRALLNAIPDVMFRVTREGVIVDYKANNEPRLLTPPRDFLGKKISEVFPPAIAEKRMLHIEQALESGEVAVSEFQFAVGDTIKEYEARTVASGSEEVVTILRDVTERKREESARKASEERFARIFQASPLPINIRYLDSGRYVDANPAYLRAVGCTLEDLQGRTPIELGVWIRSTDYENFMNLVREGKTVRDYECLLQTKSGRQVVVLLTAEIIEVNGQPCVLVISMDISRRKQAEAEREQLIAQLQEALARVKLLSGLLPICASCKKIRDDHGYWNQIEEYISDHSEAEFSHSVCPDCMESLYGDLLRKKKSQTE